MKNEKGFTLIELLAVIAIIALISLIAIPNIVGLSTGIRKDQMLDDAKKLISLAKYKVNADYEIRNFTKEKVCSSDACTFTFEELNSKGDIEKDPDGGSYGDDSYVKYLANNEHNEHNEYCVYLNGSKRKIGNTNECVREKDLNSRAKVVDK